MINGRTIVVAFVSLMSIFSSLFAQDAEKHPVRARIDLIGNISIPKVEVVPDKENARNCSVSHPAWGNPTVKKYLLTAQSVVLPYNKWVQCEFSFIPKSDGEVEIDLLSDFSAPADASPGVINAHWVYYSGLIIKGGVIRNENFIKRDAETGKVLYWTDYPENLVKSSYSSQVVKNIVKAWHFCRLTQRIKVKAGQKVTISFKAKACKFVPADKVDPKFFPNH